LNFNIILIEKNYNKNCLILHFIFQKFSNVKITYHLTKPGKKDIMTVFIKAKKIKQYWSKGVRLAGRGEQQTNREII